MEKFTKYRIFIPVLIGIIVFAYYFDFTILEPANTAWMIQNGGDGAQHYLGSYAFRADSWHFPITKTELINYPEGVAIIYTDSNPLLSIITKLLKGIFPPEYQFFGIWFFLCWILQSIIGYLLVKKVTNNYLYACLGGLLFCLLPTQVSRLPHANLVGFWLILWAIYVFINEEFSIQRKQLLFFLIFSISAMVHAYLALMTIFIALTWYVTIAWNSISTKKWDTFFRFTTINCAYGIAFVLLLWILGYFYNNPNTVNGLDGYGYYSMNINSPFNPQETRFSNFINPEVINEGQYEGFQYLGLGILLMIVFITIVSLHKHQLLLKSTLGIFIVSLFLLPFVIQYTNTTITNYDRIFLSLFIFFYFFIFYSLYKEKSKWLFLLFVPATLCFIHALSNNVVWGTANIFTYDIDDRSFFSGFFRTSRSSGRFFWVTSQILLLLGITAIYRNAKSARISLVILSIIIIIQLLDLSKLSYVIDSNKKERNSTMDNTSINMIRASKRVNFLSFDMNVAEIALLNKIPINTFYTAHGIGKITAEKLAKEDSCFKIGSFNTNNLYLFNLNHLPWNKTMEIYPAFWNNLWAIPPGNYKSDSIPTVLINKIQNDSLESIIKQIQSKEIVIISIKDEASTKLPKAFTERFEALFGSNLRNLNFRNRYLAVFKNGKLAKEELNIENDIDYSENINNIPLFVKSAEKQSTISINNINYSINERGINVVSIEKTSLGKTLISTSNFDTYEYMYEYQ